MKTKKLLSALFKRGLTVLIAFSWLSSLNISAPLVQASQAGIANAAWVDNQDYSNVTANTGQNVTKPVASTAPKAPLDVPNYLVFNGTVSDISRYSTVLEWHSRGSCPPIIKSPQQNSPSNFGDVLETINRVALIGIGPDRQLYSRDVRATNNCNPYFLSKVVFDGNTMYWVDPGGLEKLSINANVGDVPTVLSNSFADGQPYQIAVDGQFVYLSRDGYSVCGRFCIRNNPRLDKVDKNNGTITGLDCNIFSGCPYGVNLKVDPDGRFLYYIDIHSALQRMDLSNPTTIKQLATNVTSYFPEGRQLIGCFKLVCLFSDAVFIGHGLTAPGNTHEILNYNNTTESATSIYTSSDTTGNVSINDLVSDGSEIFFFEVREVPCSGICFPSYIGWLYRSGRINASSLANIYQTASNVSTSILSNFQLDTDGTKLYWIESGNVLRLSNQASALPKSPMEVTGIEVTQGVQTASNSVPLIQGKRTFVRVYVKSDDPSRDVPGITARLSATWTGGDLGGVGDWIDPTNVFSITVRRSPDRGTLNDGYLFELPWDWLNGDNLSITAQLNPNQDPEQTDGYVHDTMTVGPFHLNPSPRLELRLFDYTYTYNGTTYSPGYSEKFYNADWVQRAYPVGESMADLTVPGGGLHVSYSTVYDNSVANLVRYPDWPCEDKSTTSSPDATKPDCQNMRASAYVTSQIGGMRSDFEQYAGDTDSTSYYAMIPGFSEMRGTPATTADYFPRGQDGGKNGAGPAGPEGKSYLGTYTGHEVGHSVGLGHPATAAAAFECGITGNDPLPTYAHAHIGDNNATGTMGFLDTPSYNYPRYDDSNLALAQSTYDVMAYCIPGWMSDQNYVRIYKNLTGVTPTASVPASPATVGNWLSVFGSISTATNTANVDFLQHIIGNAVIPPINPGPYLIRLLDAGGHKLADYAFTPQDGSESVLINFGQVVPFVPGTRDLRIVRLSDQKVFADVPISASVPVISGVHLVSPPNPVSGIVTLAWTASDPDGLPLKFNILYSHDGGQTFQPFMMNLTGTSQSVDTSQLGGGEGKFRVIASDGANTASADSPIFTMANKAPVVTITLPSGNIFALYGQVINFRGEALDAQDGLIKDSGLTWSDESGVLGTGHLLSENLLNPGVHTITLSAKDSAGLTGLAKITVTIQDHPEPDGPTMQVTPGVVNLYVKQGDTTKPTQALTITNFGTGSLTWQASSDVAWLSLSATSGKEGDTVTVTGDPSKIKNDDIMTGHIMFTSTSNGGSQILRVPVSFVMGDPFLAQIFWPINHSLFLPVVQH